VIKNIILAVVIVCVGFVIAVFATHNAYTYTVDNVSVAQSTSNRSGFVDIIPHKGAALQRIQYPTNANGETYGPMPNTSESGIVITPPDLLLAEGICGVLGYVRSKSFDIPGSTPEEKISAQKAGDDIYAITGCITVPLYDSDGETVIGEFKVLCQLDEH